jgi:hypothetical protein
MEEQHIYHHHASDGPRVTMKLEKNSRGHNWEVSVSGAKTVEEALALLNQGNEELKKAYGEQP